MNVASIKQLIRQRCRLDPRLTDAYMLDYAREAVMNISGGKVFKQYADITVLQDIKTYELSQYLLTVDHIEYGTSDSYTNNTATRLVAGTDYEVSKDRSTTLPARQNRRDLHLFFQPSTDKIIRVHYSGLLEEILSANWAANTGSLDGFLPRESCLALIIYVAYQHKRNYQRDMLSKADGEEFENAKLDLEKLYNERVENP
jgi:hypothetical protein